MTGPAPHGQGTAAPEGPAQPDAAQPAGFGAVLPTSAPARSPRDCWPPERAAWTPSQTTSGCPDGAVSPTTPLRLVPPANRDQPARHVTRPPRLPPA